MRNILFQICLLICLTGCGRKEMISDGESQYRPYAPDGIPFVVADSAWKADMYGNHRAVVEVAGKEVNSAIEVVLPWRRPDMRPESKKIVIVDAVTGKEVNNIKVQQLSSETGTVIFEPVTVPRTYYIYYLPYKFRKRSGDARYGNPWDDYLTPVYEADSLWLSSLPEQIPQAKVLRFESRSRFDFFTSMGTIATRHEIDSLSAAHPENPVLFVEDRAFPIRLTDRLPVRWIQTGSSDHFTGEALRNEYYVWQVGVWAAHDSLNNIRLQFSDFISDSGKDMISKKVITCFNQEGVSWDGKPVSFTVNVPKGKVQALWCGVQIPEQITPGTYQGTVTLTAKGTEPRNIAISLRVGKEVLADKGDGDLWRHARLRWLNSRIGEDKLPVEPFQPMSLENDCIIATEKEMTVGANGLPEFIRMNGREILSEPLNFTVITPDGPVSFEAVNLRLSKEADGLVVWEASSDQQGIRFGCSAYMEYDGYIRYHIRVSSDKEMPVKDIRLIADYTPYSSEYFMGTGYKGGLRPVSFSWDWNGPWDSYWMGGVNAGLHVEFRGGSYHGPLLKDYKSTPPQVWANDGNGRITISGPEGLGCKVIASTGPSVLSADVKDFEFALLITPARPLNTAKYFAERYYHNKPQGFDKAAEEGANIANIHHAQNLNPVINYPFIVRDSLKAFIARQHQFDRKVKIYYTIRELTNHAVEIYALKSLGHEIFVSGIGYGLPWQCEHLIDDYKPAWYAELPGENSDDALVLNGFSRWINYYLEGLRWMFENYELDGIYMDDVSFDRTVMKRMRKVMAEYRPGALVDLHSNTGYSIGPANQYTDFFPYVDRLWFGESFQYNKMTPDEWLVTFSGIPFGVMSEMLQDGGNRFLGMVYGATARHSYGPFSPAPVWALWKSFGIEDARMLGYWDRDCPVRTGDPLVKATAFVKNDKVLISIGNFDNKDRTIRLSFDWEKLNMDPEAVILKAPEVNCFQKAISLGVYDPIQVKAKGGWLLVLSVRK